VDPRAAAADDHARSRHGRVARIRDVIRSYPPVRTVVSEQGRGEDATDPDGSFVAEFFVPLKAARRVARGTHQAETGQRAERAALEREFVGIDFNFSQYIQDNIEEAVSGVKARTRSRFSAATCGAGTAVKGGEVGDSACRA
jgi:cobalt-zinc-cadmium resistance protein CzcA